MNTFTYNELIQSIQGESSAEGEILLPDYCPSIMKILEVDAMPFLRSRTVRGDRLYADGTVEFRIMYISDSAEGLHTASHRLPFSYSTQIHSESEEVFATVRADIAYRSARALSPQKLYVKAAVGINASLYAPTGFELPEEAEKENLQLLSESRQISDILCTTVKTLHIAEDMDAGKVNIEKLIRANSEFFETEQKRVNGKLIIKADMKLCLTYITDSGEIGIFDNKIPVSQIIEMPDNGQDSECVPVFDLSDLILTVRKNGEDTVLNCEAEIIITAEFCKNRTVDIIEDAFSVTEDAECVKKQVKLQTMRRVAENLEFRNEIELPDTSEIIDIAVRPNIMSVGIDAEKRGIVGEGVFTCGIVGKNGSGEIFSAEKALPFSVLTPIEGKPDSVKSNCKLIVTSVSKDKTSSGIDLRINAVYAGTMLMTEQTGAVTEINLKPKSRAKTSGVTAYYAEAGDRIWDIAKHFGVPVEKTAKRNNIEGDTITESKMIFIAG